MAILSIEHGFLVLQVYNGGCITVHCMEQRGVFYSEVSYALKSIEMFSYSVIEGYPLNGVPLYHPHKCTSCS